MYNDFYTELYEAVYFFDKIYSGIDNEPPGQINECIRKAVIRILAVNNLIEYDGSSFTLTDENKKAHRHILDTIIKNNMKHYVEMYNKALDESHFFFNCINELEYEIYSRCNFDVTFETGKKVAKHLDFTNKKVLELGGNSGGLGTAVLAKNENCQYSIVDTKIPCAVGNEFKKANKANIAFTEEDIFKLNLPNCVYDYIIIVNLLHDFDDAKCLDILKNSTKYSDSHTRFIIIEDILNNEFTPSEVIMHGLRLSVECRGGRQRTIEEMERLFLNVDYKLESAVKLDEIFTMLIMAAQD